MFVVRAFLVSALFLAVANTTRGQTLWEPLAVEGVPLVGLDNPALLADGRGEARALEGNGYFFRGFLDQNSGGVSTSDFQVSVRVDASGTTILRQGEPMPGGLGDIGFVSGDGRLDADGDTVAMVLSDRFGIPGFFVDSGSGPELILNNAAANNPFETGRRFSGYRASQAASGGHAVVLAETQVSGNFTRERAIIGVSGGTALVLALETQSAGTTQPYAGGSMNVTFRDVDLITDEPDMDVASSGGVTFVAQLLAQQFLSDFVDNNPLALYYAAAGGSATRLIATDRNGSSLFPGEASRFLTLLDDPVINARGELVFRANSTSSLNGGDIRNYVALMRPSNGSPDPAQIEVLFEVNGGTGPTISGLPAGAIVSFVQGYRLTDSGLVAFAVSLHEGSTASAFIVGDLDTMQFEARYITVANEFLRSNAGGWYLLENGDIYAAIENNGVDEIVRIPASGSPVVLARDNETLTLSGGGSVQMGDVRFEGVSDTGTVLLFVENAPSGGNGLYRLFQPEPSGDGFDGWVTAFFPGLQADDAQLAPTADPDGDGVANLVEWATGGDPSDRSTANLVRVESISAGGQLDVSFDLAAGVDTGLILELTSNLDTWRTLWSQSEPESQARVVDVSETLTGEELEGSYLRLRATLTE